MEGLDNLPGKLHDVTYDDIFLNNLLPTQLFLVLNPSVRSCGSCSQSEDWSEDRAASVAMQRGPYGHMIQKSLGQSAPCSQLATDAIGQQPGFFF